MIPLTTPDLDCPLACGFTMMMGEAAGVHALWLRECPEKYHPGTRRHGYRPNHRCAPTPFPKNLLNGCAG